MKFNLFKSNLYLFCIFIVCCFAYLVSTRDLSIGTDALTYQNYFLKLESYNFGDRTFELGYHYFNYLVFFLSGSYSLFLFIYFLTFNLIYFKALDNFISNESKIDYFLAFFLFLGIFLLSSWYISATLNGLRQGFSLVLLYLALSYLNLGSKFKFYSLILLSCLFHDSTVLIVPFLFLFLFDLKKIIIIFLIIAIFYPLGINEIFINQISNIVDLPLHDAISTYSEDNEVWKGFQLNFFSYTFFWCIFFIFIHYFYLKNNSNSEIILKILMILSIFYFIFGFGSFSNRFGFVAWLFLPLIQTFYFLKLSRFYIKNIYLIVFIYLTLFFVGCLNYYLLLRPFQ